MIKKSADKPKIEFKEEEKLNKLNNSDLSVEIFEVNQKISSIKDHRVKLEYVKNPLKLRVDTSP